MALKQGMQEDAYGKALQDLGDMAKAMAETIRLEF